MSKDSSDARQPVGGFSAAIIAVASAFVIYLFLPVMALEAVRIYPGLAGWDPSKTKDWIQNSIVSQFLFIALAEILTLATVLGLVRMLRWHLPEIGLKKPKWFHPLMGIVAVVPYYAAFVVLSLIASKLFNNFDINQQQQIGFNSVHGPLAMTLTFISLVVLPPLAEEITMRGFLYTGLRKWLPRLASAILVSILFGAAHLAEGGSAGPLWVGALDTFILSMVLVYLREKTGNLWAGITLHALKNGIAFVSIYIIGVG